LTTSDAPLIRSDYGTGLFTKQALAEKYHVHPDTITNILGRCEDQDVYRRISTPGNLLITPHKTFIEKQLQRGDMQATSIFQQLIRLGACLSLSTVTKAVRKIKYELEMAAIRYETAPGQQAQADWASFKGFTVTIDGIERPIYAFFMILGYSRMRYVEFVTEMTTMVLIRCIGNAFAYFGGSTKEVLFDNMPQIVNRCLTTGAGSSLERSLIPEFTSFADYVGFDISLCRIRRPQQKGKIERFVKYFKDGFMPQLPKKTGHSLADLNEQAMQWCDEVNNQVHMTTMEIPYDRLESENLNPLPQIPYLEDTTAKVSKDGCVAFRGRVFNVDMRFAGTEGKIIDLEDTIFGYFDGTLVILGKRDLPVHVRHQYCHSRNSGKLKQKRTRPVTSDISRWLGGNLPPRISIDWKLIHA
jgi:transposase